MTSTQLEIIRQMKRVFIPGVPGFLIFSSHRRCILNVKIGAARDVTVETQERRSLPGTAGVFDLSLRAPQECIARTRLVLARR